MEDLLSFKSLRCLRIAEKLIIEDEYISYNGFQEMNQCSNKTVYDDIKYLYDEWNHILKLELIRNHARSSVTSLYSLMHLKRNMFHNEIKVQLILNIFFHPNLDMVDHSLALNFSESYLRSKIISINQYLQQYGISILYNKQTKGYIVDSEEKSVLMIFMLELMKVSQNEHLLPELQVSEELKFNLFVGNFSKFVPELLIVELRNLARINQFLEEDSSSADVGYTRVTNIYREIISNEAMFKKGIESYFKQNNYIISQEEFDKLIDILIMVGIKNSLMPIRIDNFLNRYDYFYDSYKNDYPQRLIQIIALLSKFSKETGINFLIYRSEIVYYAYIHVLGMRNIKKLNIGVYSDMGRSHTISNTEEIKRKISNHAVTSYDDTVEYELIISTTDLKPGIDFKNKNYIIISDYLTDRDIEKIQKKISEILKT